MFTLGALLKSLKMATMMQRLITDCFCISHEGRKRRWCRHFKRRQKHWQDESYTLIKLKSNSFYVDFPFSPSALQHMCTHTNTHVHTHSHVQLHAAEKTSVSRILSASQTEKAETLISPLDYIVLQIFKPYA
ncbi:hypothetical protein PAMP_014039 [Pampus punctatissimus]